MEDLERKIIEHEQRLTVLEEKVDDMKNISESINKLSINMEKMVVIQDQALKEQKEIKKDVNELKMAPGRQATENKNKIIVSVITAVLGILVGALFALIIK